MYSFAVTCTFQTKTKEQAEYIEKFFSDAQALMTCESSGFASTEIVGSPDTELTINTPAISLGTAEDANKVVDSLYRIIGEYGFATMGDLNDLIGVTGKFDDRQWGWTSIDGYTINPSPSTSEVDGFWLKLPNASRNPDSRK